MYRKIIASSYFFFNDTATTEIYTLSLHDALPICPLLEREPESKKDSSVVDSGQTTERHAYKLDRKSTRLNSSHTVISYAVFCLKKKKHNLTAPWALQAR